MASRLLPGGYRLLHRLHSGDVTEVFEAVQQGSQTRVAIKRLVPARALERRHRRALRHEARVGRRLRHRSIVRTLHYEPDPDSPFLVLEFFRASNLKMHLQRHEPLIRERAHDIISQVAEALGYLHQSGWVHADVKPDNILVNHQAEVRLIDFALAVGIWGWLCARFTGRRLLQGTPSYMSPEQIRDKPLGRASDMYSLGVVIFEMITGRPPFLGDSPKELLQRHLQSEPPRPSDLNPAVTRRMDALVLKMLAKRSKERPRDMQQFLEDFHDVPVFRADADAYDPTASQEVHEPDASD